MTNRQQWTMIAGVVMTAVFGVALAIKLRPQLNPVEIGSSAPAFQATNLRTKRPSSLGDYRGKVVLVNIWATWCPPCRAEMPSMEKLHKKLAGTDFRIAAVSVDGDHFHPQESRDPQGILDVAHTLRLTVDLLNDPTGPNSKVYDNFGVREGDLSGRGGAVG